MKILDGKYGILLVDDCLDDRLFLRRTLKRSDKLKLIGELVDGQEAIDYLKGEGIFADREAYPWPDLLLLDLKMPRLTGFDVLHWMQPSPLNPATIVLSGSPLIEDKLRCEALGAAGFFTKSFERDKQNFLIGSLEGLVGSKRSSYLP